MTETKPNDMPDVIYAFDDQLEYPGLWNTHEDTGTKYLRAEPVAALLKRIYGHTICIKGVMDDADGKRECDFVINLINAFLNRANSPQLKEGAE